MAGFHLTTSDAWLQSRTSLDFGGTGELGSGQKEHRPGVYMPFRDFLLVDITSHSSVLVFSRLYSQILIFYSIHIQCRSLTLPFKEVKKYNKK